MCVPKRNPDFVGCYVAQSIEFALKSFDDIKSSDPHSRGSNKSQVEYIMQGFNAQKCRTAHIVSHLSKKKNWYNDIKVKIMNSGTMISNMKAAQWARYWKQKKKLMFKVFLENQLLESQDSSALRASNQILKVRLQLKICQLVRGDLKSFCIN